VGLTPSAVKASAGAIEYVMVARVSNLNRTIEELQKRNIWFYAVTMNGRDYMDITFEGGVALVIGSEEDGISRLVANKCDYAVSIPMTGKIESLNASVAAGIMMYRVMSSRRK
jgi:23S rRNA (guanosine2251-2'-O)-methyltransferase